MSAPTLVAADALSTPQLHAATLAAFADYLIGPFQITPAQWPSFIGRQGVDLALSRVALVDGRIAAFSFIAPRRDVGRWRLGILGALPQARGTGAGPLLLDDFIARAAADGQPEVELECFAGNERALRLYRGRGFEAVHPLRGWRSEPPDDLPAAPAEAPRAVDAQRGFAWLADAGSRIADLPFPVTAASLRAQSRPLTFWQSGRAQLVFSVVDDTPIQLHSLIDEDPAHAGARSLAQALRAEFPDDAIVAPPLHRDDLGGAALAQAGFAPHGMPQVLMRRAAR
jgi:ribosomal protein S18 acetylase RimI-like enzyme